MPRKATTLDKIEMVRSTAALLSPLAITPLPQHWLMSDASESYCYSCARKAAWAEMGNTGEPPEPARYSFERDEAQEAIAEAVDGGEWYSGTADTPQSCTTCHATLRFSLTAYGVSYAIEGLGAEEVTLDALANPDFAYELMELFEAIGEVEDDALELIDEVACSALKVRSLLNEPYIQPPERLAA
jgi:hypothetical protein